MYKVRTYLGKVSKYQLLSVGQIADLCGVAPRTVTKWFDKGMLVGHRLPSVGKGGGDRRVNREEVVRFMTAMGFPVPEWLTPATDGNAAYLFGTDSQGLADAMTLAGYRVVLLGSNLFDIGVSLARLIPTVLVLDGSIGRTVVLSLIRKVRLMESAEADKTPVVTGRHPKTKLVDPCVVVVLVGDDDTNPVEYLETGANKVWPQSTAATMLTNNQLAIAQKETP